MLNLTLFTSLAKSALVGAVASKVVDTLISTKINNKMEQNRWIRNTKLELFSKLTEDILSLESSNIDKQIREINKTSAKIILLVKDKKLTDKLEHYINSIIKIKASEKSLQGLAFINKDMIIYLQRNIRL
ncbi:MAG: hypothetical protein C0626_11750 [Arcobacter sp.]|uniref:hypothetical protein n=1 Tax=uncultured Arcobacter sp. TaxID=165434 RepID=UPI000CB4C7EE|nr:hypothetical protein [uncultured Arcobacter sp.]PLY08528.1 MAG: hypothetical protein C0626_11750 [Arcobacter sp.]